MVWNMQKSYSHIVINSLRKGRVKLACHFQGCHLFRQAEMHPRLSHLVTSFTWIEKVHVLYNSMKII